MKKSEARKGVRKILHEKGLQQYRERVVETRADRIEIQSRG